jgi:hypothetical protein
VRAREEQEQEPSAQGLPAARGHDVDRGAEASLILDRRPQELGPDAAEGVAERGVAGLQCDDRREGAPGQQRKKPAPGEQRWWQEHETQHPEPLDETPRDADLERQEPGVQRELVAREEWRELRLAHVARDAEFEQVIDEDRRHARDGSHGGEAQHEPLAKHLARRRCARAGGGVELDVRDEGRWRLERGRNQRRGEVRQSRDTQERAHVSEAQDLRGGHRAQKRSEHTAGRERAEQPAALRGGVHTAYELPELGDQHRRREGREDVKREYQRRARRAHAEPGRTERGGQERHDERVAGTRDFREPRRDGRERERADRDHHVNDRESLGAEAPEEEGVARRLEQGVPADREEQQREGANECASFARPKVHET